MSKAHLWIAYDLGVNGDYDSLYTWLAKQQAKECGDSIAFLNGYEYKTDIIESLRKDLNESVKLGKRARIYVIHKNEKGNFKGKFIYGGRKQAPWHGYAPTSGEEVEDEG